MQKTTLNVHSIETFGTHDGPGIRLVVFLQGCNIQCKYCHNADTIPIQEVSQFSIEEIVQKAIRMKPYYGNEGGITFSGGEPLLQSKALIEVCTTLNKEGIHTNIDTNGTIQTNESKILISEIADLVMFDIKGTSESKFQNITGKSHLQNLLSNIALREKHNKPYWLRYVLIPNYTDSTEDLQFLIDTFSTNTYLEKLEILPYHKLGIHKWKELELNYEFSNVEENTEEDILRIENILSAHFRSLSIR